MDVISVDYGGKVINELLQKFWINLELFDD